MSSKIKNIQSAVLEVFQEEIPSIYYSDKSSDEFNKWKSVMTNHYHNLMNFPPKMFEGQTLLDFGAGSGEYTVFLENWGAKCTLVEINIKAHEISKKIFENYAVNYSENEFINTSIYDFDSNKKFDIVHSRGVFAHTNDPELAFKKLSSFVKPGGYLIYGDGNKSGNFQNMLQRLMIFHFAQDWDNMVIVAEKLFKEDLDRSQKFANRTRRSIIFDKWVVPRLKNPSVKEVVTWFKNNDIEYYSSYPPLLPNILSDSLHHNPLFKIQDFDHLTAFTEAFWIIQNNMDKNEIPMIFEHLPELYDKQDDLVGYIDDYNIDAKIDYGIFANKIDDYTKTLNKIDITKHLKNRSIIFFDELKKLFDILSVNDLEKATDFVNNTKELFRGAQGLRHIDFIGYKKLK